MELKFIWIDEYNVIEKLGVNFNHSDKHRFNYSDNILYLLPNKVLPINFGSNITGVTAIAGENGSGKSSLCEVVLSSTATHNYGIFGFNKHFKGIVCYGNHIFIYEELTVKNVDYLNESGYEVITFKESPFETMRAEWQQTFVKGAFIYYSNILDFRTGIEETNLANISTLKSLTESFYYSTSYPKIPHFLENAYDNRDKDKDSPLEIYNNVEGNRIVKLYLTHYNFISFISLQYFRIKCTYSGNNRWLDLDKLKEAEDELSFWRLKGIKDIENDILNEIFNKSQRFDEKTKIKIESALFKEVIKRLYRYNLFCILSIMKDTMPVYEDVYDFVFSGKLKSINLPIKDINHLLKLHASIVDKSSVLDRDEFSPYSLSHYFEDEKDWRFYLIENYYLDNNKENRYLLLMFMNLETKVLSGDAPFRRITNFNIPPLSSGESSLLTFFSRIEDVIQRYSTGAYNKETFILFIDEAEVGFHPAWKRIYFLKLIDFLNNYIKEYKFQIILTTHSPYLLSDLPSENVILLRKGINGKTEILNSHDFKTFGANIHELLGTSFFLNDGFMGAFAKEKIEDLVSFLQGNNDHFTKDSAKELISLIGDEIIADRLMDMYNEKYTRPVYLSDQEYEQWLNFELKRIKLKDE